MSGSRFHYAFLYTKPAKLIRIDIKPFINSQTHDLSSYLLFTLLSMISTNQSFTPMLEKINPEYIQMPSRIIHTGTILGKT